MSTIAHNRYFLSNIKNNDISLNDYFDEFTTPKYQHNIYWLNDGTLLCQNHDISEIYSWDNLDLMGLGNINELNKCHCLNVLKFYFTSLLSFDYFYVVMLQRFFSVPTDQFFDLDLITTNRWANKNLNELFLTITTDSPIIWRKHVIENLDVVNDIKSLANKTAENFPKKVIKENLVEYIEIVMEDFASIMMKKYKYPKNNNTRVIKNYSAVTISREKIKQGHHRLYCFKTKQIDFTDDSHKFCVFGDREIIENKSVKIKDFEKLPVSNIIGFAVRKIKDNNIDCYSIDIVFPQLFVYLPRRDYILGTEFKIYEENNDTNELKKFFSKAFHTLWCINKIFNEIVLS
ncbi:MAG: hypothetical protein KatS3mg035_1788 [Bacteroidia bacterium]|nr:MAG: hypothetical protein KatS3mg035_1788 [Bacteroidia bacterium]